MFGLHHYAPRADLTSPLVFRTSGRASTDDKNESMVDPVEIDDDGRLKVSRPKVSGKIKLTYNEATEEERALEVDADAYMKELRGQVCTCHVC